MSINYLQYINSFYQNHNAVPNVNFLVSGTDHEVKNIVGNNIIASTFARKLPLFIIDNTNEGTTFTSGFGNYHMVSVLSDNINFCKNLLDDVGSLKGVSRLRSFLSDLGFDNTRAMKVVAYLKFVKETEKQLGNNAPLTIKLLEEYGGTMLVDLKLNQLVHTGAITEDNRTYLLGRYAEVSAVAADFEAFLLLIEPFVEGVVPSSNMAVHIPIGEFGDDKTMQDLFCKILLFHLKQRTSPASILILDDGNGDRSCVINILKNIPSLVEFHMISNDIFNLADVARSVVMNKFPVKIITRHEDMESCKKIEEYCGDIDVIKRSSSITVDHRFRANSVWDMLFDTNKTQTEINNPPVREPRYRKEFIQSLLVGTGIVDFAGNKTIFSF